MKYTPVDPILTAPKDLKPGDTISFRLIAVIEENGFWTAYRGFPEWSDEEIIKWGNKLPKIAANWIFTSPNPNKAKLQYRK
jgi:hypothetical protein